MDWFRWHHGSVTDPKFGLVARKAGASLPDVLAVWAFILEKASAAMERGCFGSVDTEALDCLFNFPATENRSAGILKALDERGLTEDGRIVRWEERQPKRERTDDNSTQRVQAHRERKRQETPCNAGGSQETPRLDKSREEEKEHPPAPRKRGSSFDPKSIELPAWLSGDLWGMWCDERSARGKKISERGASMALKALDGYRQDGHSPKAVIEHSIASGFQGLYPPPKKAKQQPVEPGDWWDRQSTTEAKARELGIGPFDPLREQWPQYLARVRRAANEQQAPGLNLTQLTALADQRRAA